MKVIIPMMNSMKQMMMIEAYEPIETFSGDDKELIEQQPDIDLSLDRWSRPASSSFRNCQNADVLHKLLRSEIDFDNKIVRCDSRGREHSSEYARILSLFLYRS